MAERSALTKRIIIAVILLGVGFGAIFGWGFVRSIFMQRYFANFQPPPAVISAAKAQQMDWQPTISAVGSLAADNGVQVTTQAAGLVVKIYYDSGQMVKEGDPLVQLDDRADQQDLKNYEAALQLAQIEYGRQSKLYNVNAIAASALDQARATLQQDQANVDKTKVLISQKLIRAPFSGKLGITQINLGQYIAEGAPIISLQQMDPLDVKFTLPEQYLASIYVGQPLLLTVDALPNQTFAAKINATDAQVDEQTRNIAVEGIVPNPDYKLYPGMFTNVNVVLPSQSQVVVVPQTAVTYTLYGNSVFVVKQDGVDKDGKPILKAELRSVTTGDRQGNNVVVLSGVKAGEEVVTSGQLKLHDGDTVAINNSMDITKSTAQTMTNY